MIALDGIFPLGRAAVVCSCSVHCSVHRTCLHGACRSCVNCKSYLRAIAFRLREPEMRRSFSSCLYLSCFGVYFVQRDKKVVSWTRQGWVSTSGRTDSATCLKLAICGVFLFKESDPSGIGFPCGFPFYTIPKHGCPPKKTDLVDLGMWVPTGTWNREARTNAMSKAPRRSIKAVWIVSIPSHRVLKIRHSPCGSGN